MIADLLLAAALWTPHPSDGVEMHLATAGRETRLDFDFHDHAGYAIARKQIDRDLPANYQIVFRLKANAPSENLELDFATGGTLDFVFENDLEGDRRSHFQRLARRW